VVLRHKATNSNRHPEALGAHLCAPSLEGVTAPIRAASFEARAQSVAGLVIVILARGHLRMTARDRATAEICDAVQLIRPYILRTLPEMMQQHLLMLQKLDAERVAGTR
jgi:hypothetical protein